MRPEDQDRVQQGSWQSTLTLESKLEGQQGQETQRQIDRAVLPNGSSVDTTTALHGLDFGF